ncbi:uncharacterized protein V1518DRAFT_433984 [Limtongia smithiae]|uniref:uncharacterized protein n=1 Tax=Limtongia smithiae TaxID=1125753 RepID=UPI0034CF65FD
MAPTLTTTTSFARGLLPFLQRLRLTPRRGFATARAPAIIDDLPIKGVTIPLPKQFPSARYPGVNTNLPVPDRSALGFYASPSSSSGQSLALAQLLSERGTKEKRLFPLVNWQHWVVNTDQVALQAAEGGLSRVDALYRMPTLTAHTGIAKVLYVPRYYMELCIFYWKIFHLARAVAARVNLPSGVFSTIVSSIYASDLYNNKSNKIAMNLTTALHLAQQESRQNQPTTQSAAVVNEGLDVYIPDASEITRTEFQHLRRALSPGYVFPVACGLVPGLNTAVARWVLPRFGASLVLSKAMKEVCVKAWEQRIAAAREVFRKMYPIADADEVDGEDTSTISATQAVFRSTLPQCSQAELVNLAKAVGILPGWVPPQIVVRVVLVELLLNHITYLKADNSLIGKWGGVWKMCEDELDWALLERAVPISGLRIEQKRSQLYMTIIGMTDFRYGGLFLISDTTLSEEQFEEFEQLRKQLVVDARALVS